MATRRVRFSKTRPRQCLWIEGKAKGDPLTCAQPVFKHTSWCKEHHKRVFTKTWRPKDRVNY